MLSAAATAPAFVSNSLRCWKRLFPRSSHETSKRYRVFLAILAASSAAARSSAYLVATIVRLTLYRLETPRLDFGNRCFQQPRLLEEEAGAIAVVAVENVSPLTASAASSVT